MRIDNPTFLKSEDDYRTALLAIIKNTDRCLRIRSARLDPELFNNPETIDALSACARSFRYMEIHILVDDPDFLLKTDHKIIQLQRRLSQKVIIKEFSGDKDLERESTVISDQRGLLIKYHERDCTGVTSLTDGISSKRLAEAFIHDWQRASPARQLRKLSI